MKTLLDGKSALITGGASGIGRAACLAFARHGARVVVTDLDAEGGEETLRLLETDGDADKLFIRADISREEEVEALVAGCVDAFGRLDCAFNNAGVRADGLSPISELAVDEWDRLMATNLRGTFLCLKSQLRQMSRQGGGAIVNTASIHGLVGAGHGISAYVSSKHGVVGLTRAAALEFAEQGIRVNVLCPGHTDTPLIADFLDDPERAKQLTTQYPLGRIATPEEVAEAAVWLCSDVASFVTGEALPVDGGFLAG